MDHLVECCLPCACAGCVQRGTWQECDRAGEESFSWTTIATPVLTLLINPKKKNSSFSPYPTRTWKRPPTARLGHTAWAHCLGTDQYLHSDDLRFGATRHDTCGFAAD